MQVSLEDLVYCDLVLDEKASSGTWVLAADQHTIYPHKDYRLRITTSQNSDHHSLRYGQQNGIKIESMVMLQLKCTEGTISISTEQNCTISSGRALSQDKELSEDEVLAFAFTVPERCPRCEVTFTLYYVEPSNTDILKVATSINIALKGTYNLVDAALAKAASVGLNEALPENVAVLYVEYQGDGKLHLRGWNLSEEPIVFPSDGWETIKLAEILAKKSEVPEEIDVLTYIHSFSRHSPRGLIKWLKNLLNTHGERLCLVISERNDLGIPWEILALDHENYLGARAAVVRWKEVEGYEETRMLNINRIHHQGSVIAYFDSEELDLGALYPERESMSKLKVVNYTHLKELGHHLLSLKTIEEIGLIYLGCHGHDKMSIDERRALFKHIKLLCLKLERAKEHSNLRPLVFVNACDSALINANSDGPMDVWLALLASGYIGTLGPVGSTYASAVARRVLRTDTLQIAEVLRLLRDEAVKEILGGKGAGENFIYAFMYVYYGNPLLSLRLEGAEEQR